MPLRFSLRDAPEVIPVFPLPGALLLPRGRLPLNIFEPRYLAMIDDALKTPHRLIGMIQPLEQGAGRPAAPPLYEVGCAGRVTGLNETPDGRYLISLTGVSRFKVIEEEAAFTPYRRMRVDWAPFRADLIEPPSEGGMDRPTLLGVVRRYFEASGLEGDWDGFEAADEETLVNALCMLCPFEPREKQALLEAPAHPARRDALISLMEMGAAGDDSSGGRLQ